MATKDLNTKERMERGGTLAEQAFERVNWFPWIRTGFDRPKWSDGKDVGYALPVSLSSMPDYIAKVERLPSWVECIGCKGDTVRSIKVDKIDRLEDWADWHIMPAYLFVYNTGGWATMIDLNDLHRMINWENPPIKEFHDGPRYWEIPWGMLVEWASYTGRA